MPRITRRRYRRLTETGGAAALAGCGSDASSDDTFTDWLVPGDESLRAGAAKLAAELAFGPTDSEGDSEVSESLRRREPSRIPVQPSWGN